MKRATNSLRKLLSNKLASDSLTVLVWQAIRLACSYVFAFSLAGLVSVEDVGRYSNFVALTSLAVPIFLLKPEAMIARARFFNDDTRLLQYAGSVLAYCTLGSVACAVTILLLGPIARELTGIESAWLLMIVPYLVGYASLYTTSTLLQLHGDMPRSARTRGLEGVFRLGIGLVLVGALATGWRGALGAITGGVVVAAFLSWQSLSRVVGSSPRPNVQRIREYWHEGLPTVPLTLAVAGLQTVDRFAITSRLGLGEAGVYSFGAMLVSGIWLFAFAFQQAWAPWLYGVLNDPTDRKRREMVRAIYLFALVVALLGVGIVFVIAFGGAAMLGPAYSDLPEVMVPLAMAAVLSSWRLIFESIFYYFQKTWWLSAYALAGLGAAVGGIFAVVGDHGILGVAWVVAAANGAILLSVSLHAGQLVAAHMRAAGAKRT